MSHTTEIKGVEITDLSSLERAVAYLRETLGVKATLEQNAIARQFYSYAGTGQRFGSLSPEHYTTREQWLAMNNGKEAADYVIRLADAAFDVTLTRDGNRFRVQAELWDGSALGMNSIASVLRCRGIAPVDATDGEIAIGLLAQEYQNQVAIQEAEIQGYSVDRITGRNQETILKLRR